MKLSARLTKLERGSRQATVADEDAATRAQMECLLLASKLPPYSAHHARLNDLAARGGDNLTIPECREYERLINEMLMAGAALRGAA